MTRTAPELTPSAPSYLPCHTSGRMFGRNVCFTVQQAPYTANLWWNWVLNLDPSGIEAETLPVGHRHMETLESDKFDTSRRKKFPYDFI
ncbi:hypothetical protein AVEN_120945-1 [Araneus ventricosus]|uniref:Uncharacterized protein n=1 Tax=Araneus ventricosus TaxID=182803 RepID=A0A4Y2EEZ2_ARAVE|nr:hypothetical protein AVEN_120945-1 [Araneus ventricosus]